MDINKMVAELRADCDQLEEAILVLERLSTGRVKRRGPSAKVDDGSETSRQGAGEQEQAEGLLIRSDA